MRTGLLVALVAVGGCATAPAARQAAQDNTPYVSGFGSLACNSPAETSGHRRTPLMCQSSLATELSAETGGRSYRAIWIGGGMSSEEVHIRPDGTGWASPVRGEIVPDDGTAFTTKELGLQEATLHSRIELNASQVAEFEERFNRSGFFALSANSNVYDCLDGTEVTVETVQGRSHRFVDRPCVEFDGEGRNISLPFWSLRQ